MPIPRALVLGDINVDISLSVDSYPQQGGDAQATGRVLGSGGGGLNAAVALRALGVDVSLVGCVGQDPLSEVALQAARDRGVDDTWITRDPRECTGSCVVIASACAERTLFSHRAANAKLTASAVRPIPLNDVALFLVFGYAFMASPQRESALSLLERAKGAGCTTAIDVGLAVAQMPVLRDTLNAFDLVLANESELLVLAEAKCIEAALDALLSRGLRTVVVKCGSRGCRVATGTERVSFEGTPVDAVDTTGCGDAFSASFAWLWSQGAAVKQCAQTANQIGAMTACRRGAAHAVPTADELRGKSCP